MNADMATDIDFEFYFRVIDYLFSGSNIIAIQTIEM